VRGVKIFAEDSADYVETLVRRYLRRRADGDTFSSFVRGLPDDELTRFGATR
jgi:hypothetical protein